MRKIVKICIIATYRKYFEIVVVEYLNIYILYAHAWPPFSFLELLILQNLSF